MLALRTKLIVFSYVMVNIMVLSSGCGCDLNPNPSTKQPTPKPTSEPTPEPTKEPTPEPTQEPTKEPTQEPTKEPTQEPTKEPTPKPPQKFSSCEAIKAAKPDSASGEYDITINGKKVKVYCNMDSLCGDSKGGWMRVAYLNMKDRGARCPSGFRQYYQNGVKACGKHGAGCISTRFQTNGFRYSQVCGRVHGFQKGSTDGIYDSVYANLKSINQPYVDGVSLTRGYPRKHIWTFISALQEGNPYNRHGCPCASNRPGDMRPPSFIGNDYYCESGSPGKHSDSVLYTHDQLWDGKRCHNREVRCCQRHYFPWFKKYTGSTTDYIELRICANEGVNNEDVPVNYYEIYIK